ncbi:uncharacterized protein C2orf42 homolog [Trichogramma pretiosum]|uniref:uncharacterized protein C2orf42 homolog n=1 Tax=Trichogramma pretiosum TaxID=7493 RepID=UPI0006C969E0|nr:uncharacterized protein C2orf42 homolog [Trichogramma pretiosum]
MSTSTEERARTLLADLGKATLRGIRKCPKCGVYNGSRGSSCKNKSCLAVFKESASQDSNGKARTASLGPNGTSNSSSRLASDACKLVTGSQAQVYSVRARDRGPDHRGLVQLPDANTATTAATTTTIAETETSAATGCIGNDSGLLQAASANSAIMCFIDSCEKNYKNNVLQCHEKDAVDPATTTSCCQHVQAAYRCYAEAQPLTLRNSILSSLNVNQETKQEIWLLATDSSGPLVQRVSKNIMAVKCKVSPEHPLGYLHFSFFTTKLKDRVDHKFYCSCSSFKTGKVSENRTDARRCVHFYACVCAFASDPKLSEEFQYYINLDQLKLNLEESLDFGFSTCEAEKLIEMDLDSLSDDTHLLIFRDDSLAVQNLPTDRLDIDINLDAALLAGSIDLKDNNLLYDVNNMDAISQNSFCDVNAIKVISDSILVNANIENMIDNQPILDNVLKQTDGTMIKVLENNFMLDPDNLKFLETNPLPLGNTDDLFKLPMEQKILPPMKRGREKNKSPSSIANINSIERRKSKIKTSSGVRKYYNNSSENIDETSTSLSFTSWLASITERINQTMHFQFSGKPDPLVFHVPQSFFECLRERISCGAKKKRLPNSTNAFERREGVPLGTFTKYTWHITNVLHVKSIFETPLMPLEITKSFIQNADGTYEVYKREETEMDKYRKTENNPLIKPLELQTYLKVGNISPHQTQPTPFIIEWIPDILPVSKIGELKIMFEFGKNDSSQKYRKFAQSKNC